MNRAALIATVLAIAGCGDDPIDLTGIYEVTANVASSPCGNDAPVTGGAPYVKFKKSELFGAEYFVYDDCMDIAGTDCVSNGGLFEGLFEPIDSGWLGRTSSSSHLGTRCLLGYDETTAKLYGSHLVIEVTRYSDDIDPLPEAECTTDEAEKRNTKMGCDDHSRTDAERR